MTSLVHSESQLTALVKTAAEQLGWHCYHTHDSRRSDEGFPDLVMLRDGRQLVAELKMPGKNPTEAQREWLLQFALAGVECFVWDPRDWDDGTIAETLR